MKKLLMWRTICIEKIHQRPSRKYVQYDANDKVVSSDPEGSDEFAANVVHPAQIRARFAM